MFDVGSGEMMLILVLALLLFGAKLPEVARNVGRSVADFKRGLSDAAKPLTEVRTDLEREISEAGDAGRGGKARPNDGARPGA